MVIVAVAYASDGIDWQGPASVHPPITKDGINWQGAAWEHPPITKD